MSFAWVLSSVHGALPHNAVQAGRDSDGSVIYVGRAQHEGDLIPCKVVPSKRAAYVPYSGREVLVSNFEVLTGSGFSWVSSSNGHTPAGAVVVGNQRNGEALYMGRTNFQGSVTPGKVHKSHGCLYIPYAGAEHRITQYEVLVGAQKATWITANPFGPLPVGAQIGGRDIDGSLLYVGRASHEGDQIPGKVLPLQRVMYVSYSGKEIAKQQYEILCGGNLSWIRVHGSATIPHNAVRGGQTRSGERLYIGRVNHQGSQTPGKVHPSHKSLYIPFGGSEVAYTSFELLIEN